VTGVRESWKKATSRVENEKKGSEKKKQSGGAAPLSHNVLWGRLPRGREGGTGKRPIKLRRGRTGQGET